MSCECWHSARPPARSAIAARLTPAVIHAAPGPTRPAGPDGNGLSEGLTRVHRAYNEPGQE